MEQFINEMGFGLSCMAAMLAWVGSVVWVFYSNHKTFPIK